MRQVLQEQICRGISHMLPLFPLQSPLFPDSLVNLRIFEPRYVLLISECLRTKSGFGVVALQEGFEVKTPGVDVRLWNTGCTATIEDVQTLKDGTHMLLCRGAERFGLLGYESDARGIEMGQVRLLEPDLPTDIPEDLQWLADELGSLIAEMQRNGMEERLPVSRPYRLDECGWVANQWAHLLDLDLDKKMQILEEDDPLTRLTLVKLAFNGR